MVGGHKYAQEQHIHLPYHHNAKLKIWNKIIGPFFESDKNTSAKQAGKV